MSRRFVLCGCLAASVAAGAIACSSTDKRTIKAVAGDMIATDSAPRSPAPSRAGVTPVTSGGDTAPQASPNELGRIPVFEYHLIVDKNSVYERTHQGLRHDLETMYSRGYRPVSMAELIDKKIDLPAGLSPAAWIDLGHAERSGGDAARFVGAQDRSDATEAGGQPDPNGPLEVQLALDATAPTTVTSLAVTLYDQHGT
jgi:hypothetical protein